MNVVEKKEYKALDVWKFICALLVAAIHMNPLCFISFMTNKVFKTTICRLAVPTFFMSSGYFLSSKLDDKPKFKKYIIRLIFMYFSYAIIYLPEIIKSYVSNGYPIIACVKDFIFQVFYLGIGWHLWFFPALIFASVMLYYLHKKGVSNRTMMIISIVCLTFAIFIGAYLDLFTNVPLLNKIGTLYIQFFDNPRNGLLFGFPLVFLGYYIKQNELNHKESKNELLVFLISLVIMYFEVKIIIDLDSNASLFFSLIPITYIVFRKIINLNHLKISEATAVRLRNYSALIYGLHVIVYDTLEKLFVNLLPYLGDIGEFTLAVIICILIGEVIIRLSRLKYFKFLSYFY